MHARAVVTLGIVLDDRFPVGPDIVFDELRPPQRAQIEPVEELRHIAQ